MNRYRTHSVTFKKQVAQEYLAGETLKGLAKRHDISRNLIRLWVLKYEAGQFDGDAEAVDRLQEYEARIAALERLVGKLTLENEFLKGASKDRRSPTSGTMSIVSGPKVFPSNGDANS
jgi:transposase